MRGGRYRAALPWRLFLCALLILSLSGCGGGGGGSQSSLDPAKACDLLASTALVVGGAACDDSSRAVVRLRFIDPVQNTIGSCSGTLVTSDTILTAAHCLTTVRSSATNVVDVNLYTPTNVSVLSDDGFKVLVKAKEIVVPAFYAADYRTILGAAVSQGIESIYDDRFIELLFSRGIRDFGVVRLAQKLVRPTLPIVLSRLPAVGERLALYGFGLTSAEGTFADLPTTLNAGFFTPDRVARNVFGAVFKAGESTSCNGDSGGPIVTLGEKPGVIGVISRGVNVCRRGGSSVYAATGGLDVSAELRELIPGATFR